MGKKPVMAEVMGDFLIPLGNLLLMPFEITNNQVLLVRSCP